MKTRGRISGSTLTKFFNILRYLRKKKASRSEISKVIKIDKRTLRFVMEVAFQEGIVEFDKLDINNRQYRTYRLSEKTMRWLK